MKILKKSILFYLGGCCYCALELIWRGRTHGSMFAAGGLCFVLIGTLGEVERPLPVPLRMLLGAGIVTMVELGTGLICNRRYEVWDYRGMAGNFLGQICPVYSLLWVPVSLAAIAVYDFLSPRLDARLRRPPQPS